MINAADPTRVFLRLRTSFAVHYRLGSGSYFKARVLDLSSTGMLLETARPVLVGEKLQLEFRLPHSLRTVRFEALCVRSDKHMDKCHAGLKFPDVPQDIRDRLSKFIERRSNIFWDQLMILTFALALALAAAVRLLDYSIIQWFSGTDFGRQWADTAAFALPPAAPYWTATTALAAGILICSLLIFFFQPWARYPLAFFYGAALLWQGWRLWGKDWSRLNEPIYWLILFADLSVTGLLASFIGFVLGRDFGDRFKAVLAVRSFEHEEKKAHERRAGK